MSQNRSHHGTIECGEIFLLRARFTQIDVFVFLLDMLVKALGFLTKDEDHRLKSAAFGAALCTLTAWWNAAHFGKTDEVLI